MVLARRSVAGGTRVANRGVGTVVRWLSSAVAP